MSGADEAEVRHLAEVAGIAYHGVPAHERGANVQTWETVVSAVLAAFGPPPERARLDRVLGLHTVASPCSCGGRRWVQDEGWAPDYLGIGTRQERTEGDGLVPCGFCNHGGWDTEQHAPTPPHCDEDDHPWPCPTVLAVEGRS